MRLTAVLGSLLLRAGLKYAGREILPAERSSHRPRTEPGARRSPSDPAPPAQRLRVVNWTPQTFPPTTRAGFADR